MAHGYALSFQLENSAKKKKSIWMSMECRDSYWCSFFKMELQASASRKYMCPFACDNRLGNSHLNAQIVIISVC